MVKGVLVSCASDFDVLKTELRGALKGIREEFDEHLDAINQTAEEVQANCESLCRLEEKVERLGSRVEQLCLMLDGSLREEQPEIALSAKEKEVFLVLYTADQSVTYAEIAAGIRESEFLVRTYITSLIQKGVPVRKFYRNNVVQLELSPRFRELQTRNNLLNISQRTVKEFC